MDRFVEQLIEGLGRTEALYRQMLDVIAQETEAATQADTDRLSVAGIEKQGIAAQIKQLDHERAQVLSRIAGILVVPLERLTLSTVADHVGQPHRDKLLRLNSEIKAVLDTVRNANEACCVLVKHCLRLVQNSLGFFQHLRGSVEVYGASGGMRDPSLRNGRLLSGEV